MDVTLSLKKWSVEQKESTKLPMICGKFSLFIGEKEIATQDFNSGYGGKEIPFSDGLVNKLICLESEIKNELENLLK